MQIAKNFQMSLSVTVYQTLKKLRRDKFRRIMACRQTAAAYLMVTVFIFLMRMFVMKSL